MYPQPGAHFDPSSYAAQPNAAQRPPSALAHPTYASLAQQQPQQPQQPGGMAAYVNGGYGGQPGQPNGMVNPAMYGGQAGGMNPSFASSSAVFGGGVPGQAPYSPAHAPSTSALLQQQLAQQAALSQAGQQNQHASPYQNQQQAYNQMQQARQQQQQQQHQSYAPSPSQPSPFAGASYPQQQPPPPSAPTPSQPPPASNPSLSSSQSRPQMSIQDMQNALRGVQLAGMTPERYSQLTPLQQAALREYMQRSRAQQQAQLGLGMPSSPASNTSTPSKTSGAVAPPAGNGSPAPAAAAGANPMAGGPPRLVGVQAPTTDAQREAFFRTLSEFYNKRGQQFPHVPPVDGRQVDLTALFAAASKAGGFESVNKNRWWGYIASTLNYQAAHPTQHPETRLQALAHTYQQILLPFEQAFTQMQQLKNAQAAAAAARGGSAPGSASGPNAAFGGTAPSPASHPGQSHLSLPPATPSAPPTAPTPTAAASSPFATSAPPPASSAATPVVDLTSSTAAPSPAPSGLTRPATAVSQREGTQPPGTAGGSVPPPFGAGVDVKGKGKAVDDIKGEPLTNGVPSSSTPQLANTALSEPTAPPRPSTSSGTATVPKSEPTPTEPPRRKRRKIEYTPLTRPVETYGGYDLGLVEQTMARVEKVRRPRGLHDLGTVDIRSLTMQLRCRLPAEVSYALNTLALIALHMSLDDGDGGVPFPLQRCPDLFEELLDLLEETAFGLEDEWSESNRKEKAPNPPLVDPPASYRDLFRLVVDDANKLVAPSASSSDSFEALRPTEVVLSVLNLLRQFSQSQKNASFFGQEPRLVDILARVTALPLKPDGGRKGEKDMPRYPLHVTPADSLAIKKDVLETFNTVGLDVRLAEHSPATAQAVVDLVVFFLRDAHHRDQLYFDLSSTPSILASRHAQPPHLLIPPYLELGLSTFSRVALLDSNRSVFSRLIPPDTLCALFESLTFLLPVSEADFQICTFEAGLVHVYHIALGLYNLAFVAPVAVKLKLRSEPRFVKSLVRVVRRLAGTATRVREDDLFVGLAQRCIGVLQLLSSLGGVSTLSTSTSTTKDGSGGGGGGGGSETSDVPWWGLSMSGDADDDSDSDSDDPSSLSRRRRHRGGGGGGGGMSLRPPLPPGAEGASAAAAGAEHAGPPILAGDARALWELLAQGSMSLVFAQLVELADATTGRRRRRRGRKKRKGEGQGGEEKQGEKVDG
ncbi:hypothetical protein JCM11251_002586 [Rhodosporidiobolus azoricus]